MSVSVPSTASVHYPLLTNPSLTQHHLHSFYTDPPQENHEMYTITVHAIDLIQLNPLAHNNTITAIYYYNTRTKLYELLTCTELIYNHQSPQYQSRLQIPLIHNTVYKFNVYNIQTNSSTYDLCGTLCITSQLLQFSAIDTMYNMQLSHTIDQLKQRCLRKKSTIKLAIVDIKQPDGRPTQVFDTNTTATTEHMELSDALPNDKPSIINDAPSNTEHLTSDDVAQPLIDTTVQPSTVVEEPVSDINAVTDNSHHNNNVILHSTNTSIDSTHLPSPVSDMQPVQHSPARPSITPTNIKLRSIPDKSELDIAAVQAELWKSTFDTNNHSAVTRVYNNHINVLFECINMVGAFKPLLVVYQLDADSRQQLYYMDNTEPTDTANSPQYNKQCVLQYNDIDDMIQINMYNTAGHRSAASSRRTSGRLSDIISQSTITDHDLVGTIQCSISDIVSQSSKLSSAVYQFNNKLNKSINTLLHNKHSTLIVRMVDDINNSIDNMDTTYNNQSKLSSASGQITDPALHTSTQSIVDSSVAEPMDSTNTTTPGVQPVVTAPDVLSLNNIELSTASIESDTASAVSNDITQPVKLSTSIPAAHKLCSQCNTVKPKSEFSATQNKQKHGKCKICSEANHLASFHSTRN